MSIIDIDFTSEHPKHSIRKRFLDDWISSLAFAQDESLIYIQTAHNKILTLDSTTLDPISTSVCLEQSILYSGAILPLSIDGQRRTLIASGTVLGGVVIWELESQAILHTLSSHEGSIFGVVFSSDGKILASCSDDRSIRLWEVQSGKEIAIGWGHHARIWQLLFVHDNEKLISVSEDCSARVWSWNSESTSLICEQVLEGHLGRNVWCGALGNGEDRSVLATGGGDGRVKLWDIDLRASIDRNTKKYSMASTGFMDPTPVHKRKQEIFKNYVLLNYNHILVGTSKSRLLFFNGKSHTWKVIPEVTVDFYSIIKGFGNDPSCAAIATRDGKLFIARVSDNDIAVECFEVGHLFQGKLSDLLTFTVNTKHYVILETQNPHDPVVLFDDTGKCRAILTVPETFHPTAAVYESRTNILYLGSRHGAVASYTLDFTSDRVEITPNNCWRRVMSEDAITSILLRPSTNSLETTLILTSRGGYFMMVNIQGAHLRQLSLNRLPRCDIEGSSYSNGKLILYGFRTDLFFVWNHTDQYEVLTEKCGGAHRIWHFRMNPDDEDAYDLLYTKAVEVNHVKSSGHRAKFQQSVLQPLIHGREYRGIEFSSKKYNQQLIIATGSEDTCISLNTLDPRTGALTNWGIYEKHVSGITSLHWTEEGEYLISSSGQEELTIWKVTLAKDEGPHIYPLISLPTTCDIPDLRIMNSVTRKLTNGKYLVVSIYSDSTFRGWIFDPTETSFQPSFSGNYRECCLLNCDILVLNDEFYLSISSTDGHLAIWKIGTEQSLGMFTPLAESLLRVQLHQSSVKGSFFYQKTPLSFLHVSGGDDNSLVATDINFANGSISGTRISVVENAHSATITGIARIPGASDLVFVSIGSDQNLRKWKLTPEGISLVDSRYTTVADTGVIDAYSDANGSIVALAGMGMSIWTV
ncbi:Rtt10p [Sugiyamaella lignohabitans]|uniref:Rtt10p n=1 Tax=Sugiyamaella lignohabitans TaxID=796027 RepID=A0A170QZ15_9ASCO|nr:Rtt10p [Sugiyamaella lignohabitans]ANB15998.1 Rtt10p [Sugiyamaella lignohabitans]